MTVCLTVPVDRWCVKVIPCVLCLFSQILICDLTCVTSHVTKRVEARRSRLLIRDGAGASIEKTLHPMK
jgi:hypothetical protein